MSTTQAAGKKVQSPANALLYRLRALRRRVRLLDGWQGVCALVALALGVGVTVGTLDYFVHLPNLIRAIALVGLLVGGALVANRFLIRPFTRACDDLTLALRVEEEFPELNDSLASTVQFLKQSPEEQARLGGSEEMRQRTMAQTLEKAAAYDFSRILDRRGAAVFGACAVCVLAAAAAVVYFNPVYSGIGFWRFVEPFGPHTWTTIAVAKQAPLELLEQGDEEKRWEKLDPRSDKKDRIAIGRPYFIRVNLTGQIPKSAKIEIDGHIRTNKEIEIKPSADKHSASFITAIDMTQQHQKFKFRVLANDGTFPPRAGAWHEVEVLPPPRLIDLDGQPSPQITIYPPAYTDLSPRKLDPGVKNVDVIAGSTVVLRAKADRPLEQAWVEYRPENALITPAAVLSMIGQTHPLQAVGQAAGGNAVWGRIPARFEGDGSVFQITFIPAISGGYTLFLRDHDRLERAEPADLKINLDPLPLVRVIKPGASVTAVPTADIPFKFVVTDEQFAVRKVYLEYQRKNADGTPLDDKQISVLYDAKDFGNKLPALSARMSRAPLAVPDLRLRWKKLEFETVWSLRNEFVSGDIVHVEICAEDFCDIYGIREPGRSSAIVLRIISKSELMANVSKELGELKTKIEQANKIQKGAHETVKEIRQKDKIDPKDREAFVDKGMQPQREVQDRIDAIKREASEIRQTLAGNRLKDTQEFRDATKIAGVTDSLSQHELQQIGPKLTDAHNDLSQADKNPPKTKDTLDQAAKLQQNVRTALDQLLKDLNPEAKIRDHANDLRDIISKQEENRKALDMLNNRKEELKNIQDKTLREIEEKSIKSEIDQKAKEQEDLANRLEKLVGQMKNTQRDFEKEGDKNRAQQIKNAIDQAEPKLKEEQKPKIEKQPTPKEPITSQMKQVAEELRNKNEIQQKTLNKQEQIEQNLDKMLKALEGRNDEVVRQEMKDRKDIEQNLDKLSKKIEELRNEQKKLDQIMDKEERLKKKQELEAKQAKLQEEIAQMRRDLAKLNEQNAANKLNDAMEKLEKAAADMKQGDNPDKNLQDARKDVERAKQDLKESQEELARELLIKIADQLEGLKMREVASLERSESLQTKIMKRQKWSDNFLQTMDGNIDTQKGIADETDTFKDKLKEAKVFHSILERAKDSMDKAGEVMTVRRKVAQERLAEKFDDDEMKDEVQQHTQTAKHQKMAIDRLDWLLDALKEEINKKKTKPPPADDGNNPPDGQPDEQQGGLKNQDGIPPTAQLKALLAKQLDLNKRTEEFAKANPDLNQLNDAQKRELRELSEEQQQIHELFQGLVAPPMQPMPVPEPKEGGKK